MTRYEACRRCDCPVPLDWCVTYPVLCVLCRYEIPRATGQEQT